MSAANVAAGLRFPLVEQRAAFGLLAMLWSGPLALAQSGSPDLVQPPICSAATVGTFRDGACVVTPLGDGHNEIKLQLTAKTGEVSVGGYSVTTEHYNEAYLAPTIEAIPGDTLAAALVNTLPLLGHAGMGMGGGDSNSNSTNLHYFHGGIVSPNNTERPKGPETGNGDNIYVQVPAPKASGGTPGSFEYKVPIPGKDMLNAEVLERAGYIEHPIGLNWYHSHLHMLSTEQVMGGMSGLISVGEPTGNLRACQVDPKDSSKCLNNDVEHDTKLLKDRTKVQYALLRDLPLRNIEKQPRDADNAKAELDPLGSFPKGTPCGVWREDSTFDSDHPELREGFCQVRDDPKRLWLFTVNGQRFPTIRVHGGQNLLLRISNVSANIGYWLEARDQKDSSVLPLSLISLDGIVPARPTALGSAEIPVQANSYPELLLMPASRAELYIRNDEGISAERTFILRTRGLGKTDANDIGADEWPEVELARIVLEKNEVQVPRLPLALNVPASSVRAELLAEGRLAEERSLPKGCVRDLDPAFHEYRRVTFDSPATTTSGKKEQWGVLTEIVRPGDHPANDKDGISAVGRETIGLPLSGGKFGGLPFEEYVGSDGQVDWENKVGHVCIKLDHKGSHKQLWVLYNNTGDLHNFHIHQMKFRLATKSELKEIYRITDPGLAQACAPGEKCEQPNYQFYDDQASSTPDPQAVLWHDTIPVPPFQPVFIVMSFDATQQVGQFVFHCHILKHEDAGLMAPIEVWDPFSGIAMK